MTSKQQTDQRTLALTQQTFSGYSMQSTGPQHIFSRYFIIKSYTEEDIHKAIKYNIWSSSERGNKLLDDSFRDLKNFKRQNLNSKTMDPEALNELKDSEIFLFFSVNKSKHFCGVAKMVSEVKHSTAHSNLWKQTNKWPGSIKVDWLFIKDIPNTQFIHIENPLNENKPACQGRDCQELYPKIGSKMLEIFLNYKSTTRLFDDFKYYDEQEKFKAQKQIQKEKFNFRNHKVPN